MRVQPGQQFKVMGLLATNVDQERLPFRTAGGSDRPFTRPQPSLGSGSSQVIENRQPSSVSRINHWAVRYRSRFCWSPPIAAFRFQVLF